jgi:hypothetical protein
VQKVFTDYDVWSFQKTESGAWNWRRSSPEGEVLIIGHGIYESFDECMEDARRHGYTGSFSVTP